MNAVERKHETEGGYSENLLKKRLAYKYKNKGWKFSAIMSTMKLPNPKNFIHPNQPTFIYNTKKSWEKVIEEKPIWLSGKFPPLPKEKKYKFLGHRLITPIAIAAGPASKKIWTDFYFKMGYGLVFEKTRRTVPRRSNQIPNIVVVRTEQPITRNNLNKKLIGTLSDAEWEKYKSMTNSFGNPSPAVATWSEELTRQRKGANDGQILGCSVTATIVNPKATMEEVAADLLIAATAAAISGAQAVEFNLACPNVTENKQEGDMFQDAKLVSYILSEFKRRFPNLPTGIKFGLYKSKALMKKILIAAGDNLDYFSGINTVGMTVVAKDGSDILPGRRVSGVAGRADQTLALEAIRWSDEIRKEEGLKYEILGGGGIVEVEDVDRYLNAGADMVQVAAVALADPLFAYKYRFYKLG